MSIGSSGRIVIEVEPEIKRQLYASLTRDGMSLKEWFLKNAEAYIASRAQMSLHLQERHSDALTGTDADTSLSQK